MKTALVTAIGSFSADIVIKSLKRDGFRVVGCDIYPAEWVADAGSVHAFYKAPYATDESAYLSFVREICCAEKVNYILPLTDVEVDVFNANRPWFEEKGIRLCISSRETIDICRDKKKQFEFLKDVEGVRTIPTCLVKDAPIPEEYPVVCKPFNGRSSQGLKYIHSREEYEAFLAQENTENYIVQPYISGPIVTVDVVRQADGQKTVAIPRIELLRTLNGAGTSVHVFGDEKLMDMCVRIANAMNIVGCVNYEFIRSENGGYAYIECNPRFAGGVEFSCIAGYDCVLNHVRSFEGCEIDDFRLIHEMHIARKYEEIVTKVD